MSATLTIPKPQTRFGSIPPDWEIRKFDEITEIIGCGLASTPTYVEKGIPFLSAQNVQNGKLTLEKYKFISTDLHQQLTKNRKPTRNDILYSRVGAGFGQAALVDIDLEFSIYVSLTHIRLKSGYEPGFYMHLLNSNYCKKQALNGVFQGGGVPNLNVEIVKDFDVVTPPQSEQLEIANILSTWDDAIIKTEALIDVKKIEFIRLRTKLTQNESFEKQRLCDISTEITRRNDQTDAPTMMISSTRGFIPQSEKYDKEMAGQSLEKYILLRKGEFAYNKGNSKTYPYGCIFRLEEENALIPFVYYCFNLNADLEPRYFRHFFEGGGLNKQLKPLISSSARSNGLLNINRQDFFACEIPVPSRDYQRLCAAFLDLKHQELELLEAMLDAYKTQKKGLMQQLLTGKVRVKV